ncbi:hypothetical protein BH10PSE14_BH10PSE14_32340 [soil metagenome]
MTDAPVTLTMAPAGDVIVLDLWAGMLPALDPAIRVLPVEPRRWWLVDAAPHADAIAATIAANGALTPIGGGLVRATLSGPGWRDLLTVSGCFDSEHPGFATGQVAATVIHHVPVWIAVTGDATGEVYMAASYAPTLAALWTTAIGARPSPSLPRPGSA